MRRAARPLLYAGTVAVVLALAWYHARYVGHYPLMGSSRLGWGGCFVLGLCLTAYAVGLPDLQRTTRAAAGAAVTATAAAALAISALALVTGTQLLPRLVVLTAPLLLIPWYSVCALVATAGTASAEGRDRVVAVMDAADAAALERELQRAPERPATIVKSLVPDEVQPDRPWAEPLVDLAIDVDATVVVLDRTALSSDAIVRQAATLHEAGVRVRTLALFYDEWLGKLPISELERVSLMFDIGELHRARYMRAKRLLDLAVALLGLVPLGALTLIVALGDAAANRGPLLFTQERVGRDGRTFRLLKFRTMRPGTGKSDWTQPDDDRVTPFGRVLRRTHLDELPQLVNVLLGDLSVVGPRPEQPRYVERLSAEVPFYRLRHLVRPGLTGWAQVKYWYGASEMEAVEKLQYEFFYLRHQDLYLDLRILGRTVRAVILAGGR